MYQNLDPKKALQKDGIKTNILKKNEEFFAKHTCKDINDSTHFSKFPTEEKEEDIRPTHKYSRSYLKNIKDLLAFSLTSSDQIAAYF